MLKKLFIIGISILLLIPILWVGFPYYTAQTIEITVTDKERVPDGEDGSYYLIFTEDEVFKNVDVWRRLKARSSDLQGQLQMGRSFEVTVYGWRIPILSKYRNIVSIASEITPSMGAAVSLPDLKPSVERVSETKLPAAVLYPQRAHATSLTNELNEQFPDLTVRVFGEESSDVWGFMIFWDPVKGIVLEATPLAAEGEEGSLKWGPSE